MAIETFGIVSNAITGTAPTIYVMSVTDSLAVLLTPGYLQLAANVNYVRSYQLKNNDIIYVNYADTSVFPLSPAGLVANSAKVVVNFFSGVLTLLQVPENNVVISQFTITEAELAAGGAVNLIVSTGTEQFQIMAMSYLGAPPSINFSGGGGNRLGQVTDGTTVYSLIPAASMEALVNSNWGSAGLPLPAAASIYTKTAAGADLQFKYSGGTTDYTAGAMDFTIAYQRVA